MPLRWHVRRSRIADVRAEDDRYYLKAMNCPHHHRSLPRNRTVIATCRCALPNTAAYRYEQSGELFGLMRVRSLKMNDAHIYCTEEQFADEFRAVNDMYLKYFKIFGIEKYSCVSPPTTGQAGPEIRR